MLTQEQLKKQLSYNPDTGVFTWINKRSGRAAGTLTNEGYINICIDYKLYRAHRLVFLYMTGEWPKDQVDHINHDEGDNRWVNLRDVTQSINKRNSRGPQRNNMSGFVGVHRRGAKFRACSKVNGKTKYFGNYDTPEQAYNAYLQGTKDLRG